jgi:hypothetical protein
VETIGKIDTASKEVLAKEEKEIMESAIAE